MLEWLEIQGHQKEMADTLERLESQEPPLRAFLTAHRQELETGGIAAWDLGRAAQLVRWGATARFLPLPEAWSSLKKLEDKAKALYHNEVTNFDYVYAYSTDKNTDDDAVIDGSVSYSFRKTGTW